MTREEMVKRRWKAYEIIEYKDAGMAHAAECLFSAIDFDAELLTLTPINDFYEQNEFKAPIQFCSLPKMKVAGKKKAEPTENFIRAKKIGMGDYFEDEFDNAS